MVGLGAASASNADPLPKRVLIVHSFGRDFAPYDTVIATFRRELASRSQQPVLFLEATLDAGRVVGAAEEAAFAAYLAARFSDPKPDLLVSVAPPAATFLRRHRDALFPGVPVVLTAANVRLLQSLRLEPGDIAVINHIDLLLAFETILRLLPQTQTIAVVIGATPLERFWRTEAERDAAPLADRVRFEWMDPLSLPQMQQRVAALPPHSAVLYGLLVVDAAGTPHVRLEALNQLRQASNAPIFSLFEAELGHGVVGGPFLSQTRAGSEAARLALPRLTARFADAPEILTLGMEPAVYDARELGRWQIDESRLPPGSEVRFREPSPWVRYRAEIIQLSALITAQAALIGALLVQRRRRRSAEQEAHSLGGRLITAYEDAGRRLARELHDDITQRLAGVSIEAATLNRISDPAARQATEQSIVSELSALSRDVHALSYRLHPSAIDDLGLAEALRIEGERAARRSKIEVTFDGDAAAAATRGDGALCLFRVAQEALRNALRHGKPQQVRIELREREGGTSVSVADDGSGFDPSAPRLRASLGLVGMRERVALLGGRLEIRSRPGQGTTVTAWLPQQQVAT